MIVRHDIPDQNFLVDESDYPGIITFFNGDGAGTLIAPLWILTAAHTARNISDNHIKNFVKPQIRSMKRTTIGLNFASMPHQIALYLKGYLGLVIAVVRR
ncbi:MAG: hypothetical protein KME17_03300 [Cyanosarcina radialis HA8281-LM2]|jgi:hypothetical protein|nr:hypothetical protein [Cyanosarcina radialis HA8281-LM2]